MPGALDTLYSKEEQLAQRVADVRAATRRLCEPLSAEDAGAQSMPQASPAKWHLAHTSWFFETFVLVAHLRGYRPFHPAFHDLFNSYYNGVGQPYPRAQRGLLTRPSLDEVLAYRAYVESALLDFLLRRPVPQAALELIELGLHHEQQHQELMLTDIKHLFAQNPLRPAYRPQPLQALPAASALQWQVHEGGSAIIGHDGVGFAFDNEGPAHRVLLQPFALASRPVLNGEYREFVEDGGYRDARLWLSDGWDLVQAQQWQRPLYWHADLQGEFTLHGDQPLDPQRPVSHLSGFEADAYARWAGARLPTEFEWEAAASGPHERATSDELHPRGNDSLWCWTGSAYLPYPGYTARADAIGEYNGKFMCNQWVLRGGSFATPRGHRRRSYRNFFPPEARWQFSGLRLARNH